MSAIHGNLTQEKWNGLPRSRQILNIASELQRALKRLSISPDEFRLSLERAFELIDLTIEDRWKWSSGRLKELLRFREVMAEYYLSKNRNPDEMKKLLRLLLNFDPLGSTLQI